MREIRDMELGATWCPRWSPGD